MHSSVIKLAAYKKLKNKTRYTMVRGGRGSAKSFHVALYLLDFILHNPNEVILYTRYTMNSAKISIIPEFREKINLMNYIQFFEITSNEIYCKITDSKILFSGIKTSSGNQTAKLKSIQGLTGWVLDEAEEMVNPKEFHTIDDSIRKKGGSNKVFLIFNSIDIEHWIYKEFYLSGEREDTTYILTDYRINIKNLDKSFIDKAERIKKEDPEYYAVNYLGKFSEPSDIIFYKGYEIFDDDPNEFDWVGIGLDWGFSDHPLAAVKVWSIQNKLYCKTIIYKEGVTNEEAAEILSKEKLITVCDSAEQKSIFRLRKLGVNAYAAQKGPGSVIQGLKNLQNSTIFIHRSSIDLQKEFKRYSWKKLASGEYVRNDKGFRVPVKQYDDGIDAIRYLVQFFKTRT